MNVNYLVELTDTEREQLEALNRGGTVAARRLKRANILLTAAIQQPRSRPLVTEASRRSTERGSGGSRRGSTPR